MTNFFLTGNHHKTIYGPVQKWMLFMQGAEAALQSKIIFSFDEVTLSIQSHNVLWYVPFKSNLCHDPQWNK